MISLPPGPQQPGLWQTLTLVADPIAFFDRCQKQYGATFTSRVLGPNSPPVVFVGEPDLVQEIFTAPLDTFALGKVTHVFRPLTGPQSLIMLDGAEHLRQRKLLMPPLHGDRLKTYADLIVTITQETLAKIPTGRPVELRPYLAEITLKIILRVVFGLELGPRYEELNERISRLLDDITQTVYSSFFFFPLLQQDWGPWSPWGHFLRQRAAIDRLVYAEIAERRAAGQGGEDILSLLLAARDEQGEGLTDQELRDQLMTLLLLGHETTASSLAWAIYWCYCEGDRLAQLQAEVEGADPLTLAGLPYLNAVCQETLRIYPIALISQPRIVKTNYHLGSYECDPGTILIPCIYLAHRLDSTYPNPLVFQPERFSDRKFTAFEYFPFGGGHRGCIGAAFSRFEMQLILGTLLQQPGFTLHPQGPIQPQRRGITFVPKGGIWLEQQPGAVGIKKPVLT